MARGLTSDALDDVALEALLVVECLRLGEQRALGVDAHDDDARVTLLELARDARQRPARSSTGQADVR